MKCPNASCGGKVEQHIDSVGGSSRYCLDGCGYYEELPAGTMRPEKPKRQEPVPPPKKRQRRRYRE